MPSKLSTTISKIATIPNHTNSALISEFHKYMETGGASERHQNNSLKMVIAFAFFIGKDATFYDVKSKEQISSFLDTKVESQEEDPDKRWIITWNYYLVHIKRFFRWLHNCHKSERGRGSLEQGDDVSESQWITPQFVNIFLKIVVNTIN
jgi:integrase/recombinase XerD